jgi:hypothetical protein
MSINQATTDYPIHELLSRRWSCASSKSVRPEVVGLFASSF